jgi:uncharacterized protein YbjT (DUF2867 family)
MYVITGATGHTGTIAAKTLLSRGHSVRVLGRSAERLRPLTSQGAEQFLCDLTDAARLTQAFQGAQGVYVLIPPDVTNKDYRGFQERVSDALASAVAGARVEFVVSLSSFGADKPDKTGPVVGLHDLEQKLNRIDGVNVLHLRAGYFMENTLPQARLIRQFGTGMGPLRPELKLPMIATRDIGTVAAEALIRLDFKGKQSRELLGQRDLTMPEAIALIGKAIGKPDLSYVQATAEQFVAALVQFGFSQSFANLMIEMVEALNSGHMKALEPRTPRNTTPTSYETFVTEEFVPAFQQANAA